MIVVIFSLGDWNLRYGGLSKIILLVGSGLYLIYVIQLTHSMYRLKWRREATSHSPAFR